MIFGMSSGKSLSRYNIYCSAIILVLYLERESAREGEKSFIKIIIKKFVRENMRKEMFKQFHLREQIVL